MFEKQLYSILLTYLQRFVIDLNEEQLNVSIWSGNLVLRNLQLQPTILDEITKTVLASNSSGTSTSDSEAYLATDGNSSVQSLLLPFTVTKGVISELRLTIPWAALDREPISIEVNGLDIVLAPLRARPYTFDEERARVQALKETQLNRFERKISSLLSSTSEPNSVYGSDSVEQQNGTTDGLEKVELERGNPVPVPSTRSFNYLDEFVKKIIRNVHVVLRSVHLSYTFDYPGLHPTLANALSVYIKEVYITTTDESFEDRFVYDLTLPVCKKVEAIGISVTVCGGRRLFPMKSYTFTRERCENPELNHSSDDDTINTGVSGSRREQREENEKAFHSIDSRYQDEMKEMWIHSLSVAEINEFRVNVMMKEDSGIQLEHVELSFGSDTRFSMSFGAVAALWVMYASLLNAMRNTATRKYLHLLEGEDSCSVALKRWKFALHCVLDQRRSKQNRNGTSFGVESGGDTTKFSVLRKHYCELYKRSLNLSWLLPLSEDDRVEMRDIEKKLPLESVLFLRSFARAEIPSELASIRLQKRYVEDARRRKVSVDESSRVRRLFKWFRPGTSSEVGARMPSTGENTVEPLSPVILHKNFTDLLQAFWRLSEYILESQYRSRMEDAGTASSTSVHPFQKSVREIIFSKSAFTFTFVPDYWNLKNLSPKGSNPVVSFLEGINQYLLIEVKDIQFLFCSTQLENGVSPSLTWEFSMGSVQSHFRGTVQTALLFSHSRGHSDKSSDQFVDIHYSQSQKRIDVHSFSIVCRPTHEMKWWSQAIGEGVSFLKQWMEQDPDVFTISGGPPGKVHISSDLHSSQEENAVPVPWSLHVDTFQVVVPLSNSDYEADYLLNNRMYSTEGVSPISSSISCFNEICCSMLQDPMIVVSVPNMRASINQSTRESTNMGSVEPQFNQQCSIYCDQGIGVSFLSSVVSGDSVSTHFNIRLLQICSVGVDFLSESTVLNMGSSHFWVYPAIVALVNDTMISSTPSHIELGVVDSVTSETLRRTQWKVLVMDAGDTFVALGDNQHHLSDFGGKGRDYISILYQRYYNHVGIDTSAPEGSNRTEEKGKSFALFLEDLRTEVMDVKGEVVGTVLLMPKQKSTNDDHGPRGLYETHSESACRCLFRCDADGTALSFGSLCLVASNNKRLLLFEHLDFSSSIGGDTNISLSKFYMVVQQELVDVISVIRKTMSSFISEPAKDYNVHPCSYKVQYSFFCREFLLELFVPSVQELSTKMLQLCLTSVKCEVTETEKHREITVDAEVQTVQKLEYGSLFSVAEEFIILSKSRGVVGVVQRPKINVVTKTMITSSETDVSFKLSHGHLALYFPFLFEVMQVANDPFYRNLQSILQDSTSGYTLSDEQHQRSKPSDICHVTTTTEFVPSQLHVDISISDIEVFLSSDCVIPINYSCDKTYFFLYIEKIESALSSGANSPDSSETIMKTAVQEVSYYPSDNPNTLTSFLRRIDSTTEMKLSGKQIECAIRTVIANGVGKPNTLSLSVSQLCSLAGVFQYNWMIVPDVAPSELVYKTYTIESHMPEFLVKLDSGGDQQYSVHFRNGTKYFFENTQAKIIIEDLSLASVSEVDCPSEELSEKGAPLLYVDKVSVAINYVLPNTCIDEPTNNIRVEGISFWYRSSPWICLSRIGNCLARSLQDMVVIREESFRRRKREVLVSFVPAKAFHVLSFANVNFHFLEPFSAHPLMIYTIKTASFRADMEQDLLVGVMISIEKQQVSMASTLDMNTLLPPSIVEVLAGCENVEFSARRNKVDISKGQCQEGHMSISEKGLTSPWNIELRLQIPIFTIHFDHFNRLIAFINYETSHWRESSVDEVQNTIDNEEPTSTPSTQSAVFPKTIVILCTGFEVTLPCKLCSLYVQHIEISQKEIVENSLDSTLASPNQKSGQQSILCAKPSVNVRNTIIDVGEGNGSLKLPDLRCDFVVPLQTGMPEFGTYYEGEVHVMNSLSSLSISENFIRHLYLLYMRANEFKPSIPLPPFYSENRFTQQKRAPIPSGGLSSWRKEGALHLIFDYPLECTVEGNLFPGGDLIDADSNNNCVPQHRYSLLGIGRLLGSCRLTIYGKVTEQAIQTDIMFYGNYEILDGQAQRLMFWSAENLSGAATPVLSIKADVEHDSIYVNTVINGINFECNARVVDFVVQVQHFYNRIICVSNAANESIRQCASEEDLIVSSPEHKKEVCVELSGRSISWIIDDTARLTLGEINCKLQLSEQISTMRKESQKSEDIYSLRLGYITLQHPCSSIQYASISSGELVAGVGTITLRLDHLVGSNFDVYPRIAYRLSTLQNYVLKHVNFPKDIEKDFERKMLISITSVEARVWKDETMERVKPQGFLCLRLPAIVLKAVITSKKNQYSLDMENSVLEFVFLRSSHSVSSVTERFLIVDKFCISVQHEEDLIKRIQSTTIRCAKCNIAIPTGTLLYDCMFNVFNTFFYYVQEEKKMLNESIFSDMGESSVTRREESLSSVTSGKWSASRLSFYLPELQISLQPDIGNDSMLMGVGIHHFSFEWNINNTSSVTIIKVHALSSFLDKNLFIQGPFIVGKGVDGAVDPQSKDGVYLRLEKLLTSESRADETNLIPSEKITITGRLNNLQVTLSPDLLICLNTEVLSPIASAASLSNRYIQEEQSTTDEPRYLDMLPIRAKENITVEDNVVFITSDVVISSDFFIGGDKNIILHFKKNRSSRFPRNVINVSSLGNSTIFVSAVTVDGRYQPSIVVEDGLTVNFIKTRLSLGCTTLDKVVLLGMRSLFNVDPTDIVMRTAAIQDVPKKVVQNNLDQLERVFRQVDVDVAASVGILLWARIEKLTLKTKVTTRYHLEKVFVESNPEISDYLDEHGSVQLDHIVVESNTTILTEQGFRVVAEVQHKKIDEEHGVSIINLHLPVVDLSLTLMQLYLFQSLEREIQKSMELVYKTCTENRYENSYYYSPQFLSPTQVPPDSKVREVKQQRSLLELTVLSPSVSLTLLNELSGKVGILSIGNTKLVVEGDRNLSHLTCQLHSSIIVEDFPTSFGGVSRTLFSVAPEVLLTSSWYGDGSTSLEIAFTCSNINCTLPLLTLCKLSTFHLAKGGETSGPFMLKNDLGTPVTVMLCPSNVCHLLQPDTRVETDFYVGRTTPLRVLLGDKRQFIKDHSSEIEVIGHSVDFCKLEGGATIRIPLLRNSIGVLDAVFRILDSDRVIHMTSSVFVENRLHNFSVELSDNSVWRPGEARYTALDALTLPLRISVGPFKLVLVPPQKLTLESIISAFILLQGEALKQALAGSSRGATYLVTRDVLKTHLCLQNTEECKITENVPNTLTVALMLHKRIAHEQKAQLSSAIPKYEVHITFDAVYTLVNLTGSEVRVHSSGAPLQSVDEGEIVRDGESFNFFPHSQTPDEWLGFAFCFSLFNINLYDSHCNGVVQCDTVPLKSAKVIPLTKRDGSVLSGIVAEHTKIGTITLRSVGMIQNHLPIAVCAKFTRGPSASEVIVLPPESRIPIFIPLNLNHPSSVDEPMYVKIASADHSSGSDLSDMKLEWSDVFLCNAPVPPTTLSTKSCPSIQVLVVSKFGLSMNERSVPVVTLTPKWCIRNDLAVPFQVRLLKRPDEVHLIQPGETDYVLRMPSSTTSDPDIQFRIMSPIDESNWSSAIKLGTLCSANSTTFHWKYRLSPSMAESVGKLIGPLFEISRVPTHPNSPMEDEWFINLSLSVSNNDMSQCILAVGADELLPLMIENRTNVPLQIRELPHASMTMCADCSSPWAYFVPLFSDVGMSLDSLMDSSPPVRIDLLGGTESSTLILDNLSDAAVSEEVLKLGSSLFVTVTVKPDSQSYIITVTENQLLHHKILSPSRGVVHVDLLIENVSLYVASPWVYDGMDDHGKQHILGLVRHDGLRVSATTGERVEGLRENELDLILCQVTGFYAALSLNEKHIIGNGSVGRIEVLDCTSPIPVYPVLFSIARKNPTRSSAKKSSLGSTPVLPCVSTSFHVLRPRKIVSTIGEAPSTMGDIIKVIVKELRLDLGEVGIRVHDTFLYIVFSAGKRLAEHLRETEHEIQSKELKLNSTMAVPETLYDFTLTDVSVSSVDFSLTITRRADGLLNPFKDITKGMHFIIPSVENAPITLPYLKLNNSRVRSVQPSAIFSNVIWPSYRAHVYLQIYKVIGSMELLGNPLALVLGWGRGVRSLLSETVSLDPLGGAQSFMKEAACSTLHSVGLLSHVGSQVASKLTFDGHWVQKETESGLAKPPSVVRGVAKGIVDGIGGVIQKPLSGARDHGVQGFFSGVAGGVAGLVSRPLSGVLRSVGDTAQLFILLMDDPLTSTAVLDAYLKSDRNFIRSTAAKESLSGRIGEATSLQGLWRTGVYMTADCYASTVQAMNEEGSSPSSDLFTTLISEIGIHNVALHCDFDTLLKWFSEEEMYCWMEIVLIGCCGRYFQKYIGFSHSLGIVSPLKEVLWTAISNREEETAVYDASMRHVVFNSCLKDIKDATSPQVFQKCSPLVVRCTADSFTCFLHGSRNFSECAP